VRCKVLLPAGSLLRLEGEWVLCQRRWSSVVRRLRRSRCVFISLFASLAATTPYFCCKHWYSHLLALVCSCETDLARWGSRSECGETLSRGEYFRPRDQQPVTCWLDLADNSWRSISARRRLRKNEARFIFSLTPLLHGRENWRGRSRIWMQVSPRPRHGQRKDTALTALGSSLSRRAR
jgi:hypothetical protein